MTFERLPDETDEELILRIGNQKESLGYTWEDLKDVLNELTGNDFGESTYRKKYKAYTKILNNFQLENTVTPFNSYSNNVIELQKERIKLQSEKIEFNKNLRELARDELITEHIVDAIKTLKQLPSVKYIKPIYDKRSYLLCITDAHYGVEFEVKDLFGTIINAYSPEIFEERMNLLFSELIDTIKKENITELNIFELGDSINGMLRLNSQLMQLRYGIVESAILYAEYLATWLSSLSTYVRIKYQAVADSNHSQLRLLGAPKNAFPDENMEKVITSFLKERLKYNKNITIIENPTGMNYAQLSCYTVLGIHGEKKNLTKAINDYSRSLGVPIDYLVSGHVHHSKQEETGIDSEVLSVKSIMGVDPYGMSLQKTSNAGTSLFVFEQGKGKVMEYTYKLN